MTLSPPIPVGRWSLRFMADIDRDSAINLAAVANSVSNLAIPNLAVIGRARVEVIQHRGAIPWVLTGVIDVSVSEGRDAISTGIREDVIGADILARLRAAAPNANVRPYRDLSLVSAAPLAAPVVVPLLAPLAIGIAAMRHIAPNTAARVAERAFPTKIVTEVLPFRPNTQPESSSSTVGALASAASRRVSEDPTREGVIGATAVGDAARQVREATTLSTGATIAIVAASVAVTGVAIYLIARKVL